MSDLTSNQLLAIELRKIANLFERIPLHANVKVHVHSVPQQARKSIMELFGGEESFKQVHHGSCVWHETEYLFGDMEIILHHAREVAA